MKTDMECYSATFLSSSPPSFLSRCRPSSGLCYWSSSVSDGGETVQLGCWPSQGDNSLVYEGDQCLPEVNRLLCLCTGTLCNTGETPDRQDKTPEGSDWHGVLLVGYMVLALLVLLAVIYIFWRECSRGRGEEEKEEDSDSVERQNNKCHLTSVKGQMGTVYKIVNDLRTEERKYSHNEDEGFEHSQCKIHPEFSDMKQTISNVSPNNGHLKIYIEMTNYRNTDQKRIFGACTKI